MGCAPRLAQSRMPRWQAAKPRRGGSSLIVIPAVHHPDASRGEYLFFLRSSDAQRNAFTQSTRTIEQILKSVWPPQTLSISFGQQYFSSKWAIRSRHRLYERSTLGCQRGNQMLAFMAGVVHVLTDSIPLKIVFSQPGGARDLFCLGVWRLGVHP